MERLRELLEVDQGAELERSAQNILENELENEVEVFAFTIEQALQNAADALNTSIVNLEYEILEKGKAGFLGFGKRPYRILVKRSTYSEANEIDNLSINFDAQNEILLNKDGSFKVIVRKKGAMLRVEAPRGEGKPVKFEDVVIHIQQRGFLDFDQERVRRAVENPNNKEVKFAEYIPSPNDSTFQIQVSPDEMKAFITITKPEKFGRVLEVDEVIEGLRAKNVHFGIKDNVIRDAIDNELYNMPILVAEGEMPIEGKDAEIQYHFKTSTDVKKLDLEPDGSIDFHKLNIVQSVVVGQVLATKIPATKGKPGKTISGRIIPARDGRDTRLLPGKNTHLSDDETQLISDINGQVIFKNQRVNVEPVLEITGDVDLTTGDINFPGNVVIFGSVNDTFKVYSGGNIEVKGNIGKAEVVAEGNIIVRQGIQGKDEAKVTCGGDLFARFMERVNVRTEGDIIVSEVILHSNVDCKGSVICSGGKRSQIAGGHVRALYEINAKYLGAEAYTETILEAGIDPDAEDKLIEINTRRNELSKELTEIGKALNNLSMMMATSPLPENKEQEFQTLTMKNVELREELNALNEQFEEIQNYLETLGKDAKISASKITYPGVKVKIKSAILIVKSEFKFVTFYKEGADIKIVPYEKPKEIEEKITKLTTRKKLSN